MLAPVQKAKELFPGALYTPRLRKRVALVGSAIRPLLSSNVWRMELKFAVQTVRMSSQFGTAW